MQTADVPKSSGARAPFNPDERKEWLEERAFMEGLANTRFGYLLVFTGLLVPVLFNTEVNTSARAALSAIITFVTFRVSLTVIRAHFKFRDAVDAIKERAPDAPVASGYTEYNTESLTHKRGWIEKLARALTQRSVSDVIGVQLPLLLTALLLLATLTLVADATGLCKTWLHESTKTATAPLPSAQADPGRK